LEGSNTLSALSEFADFVKKAGPSLGAQATPGSATSKMQADAGVASAGDTDAGGATPGQTTTPHLGPDYDMADSHPTHVRVIKLPEEPGVNLPTSTQTDPDVDIIERGSKKKERMKLSAVVSSPQYVDKAAQKMTAKPVNLTTLEVKTMQFTDSGGGTFDVNMSDIRFSPALPALSFERNGKFIYPLFRTGEVLFDTFNTPQIVSFAKWVNAEIKKRLATRLEITKAGFQFMIALAELAGAAEMPEAPGGKVSTPRVVGRSGGKPAGGGAEPPSVPRPPEGPAKPPTKTIVESPPPPPKPPAKPAGPAPATPKQTPAAMEKPNIGTGTTQPAPPQRPAQGRPLDSTHPGVKNQPTVETGSPGTPAPEGSPSSGGPNQPKLNTLEPKNLPANQQISIKTPGGPKQLTVGQYRSLVRDAEEWIGKNRVVGTKINDERQLVEQATEKFGLDKNWRHIDNPYIY
jgi:hypothetical protein